MSQNKPVDSNTPLKNTKLLRQAEDFYKRLRSKDLYIEYEIKTAIEAPDVPTTMEWFEMDLALSANHEKSYQRLRAQHPQRAAAPVELEQQASFDGKRLYSLNGTRSGFIQTISLDELRERHSHDLFFPLLFRPYTGKNPRSRIEDPNDLEFLPECFSKRPYFVAEKLEEIEGDRCYRVHSPGIDTMWILEKEPFAIRKRELRWSPDGPLRFRQTADFFVDFGQIRLPKSFRREDYGDPKKLPGILTSVLTLETRKITFGSRIADDQFRLQFPADAVINDLDERKEEMAFKLEGIGRGSAGAVKSSVFEPSRKALESSAAYGCCGVGCFTAWIIKRRMERMRALKRR